MREKRGTQEVLGRTFTARSFSATRIAGLHDACARGHPDPDVARARWQVREAGIINATGYLNRSLRKTATRRG
jgi:hypothetical protein